MKMEVANAKDSLWGFWLSQQHQKQASFLRNSLWGEKTNFWSRFFHLSIQSITTHGWGQTRLVTVLVSKEHHLWATKKAAEKLDVIAKRKMTWIWCTTLKKQSLFSDPIIETHLIQVYTNGTGAHQSLAATKNVIKLLASSQTFVLSSLQQFYWYLFAKNILCNWIYYDILIVFTTKSILDYPPPLGKNSPTDLDELSVFVAVPLSQDLSFATCVFSKSIATSWWGGHWEVSQQDGYCVDGSEIRRENHPGCIKPCK